MSCLGAYPVVTVANGPLESATVHFAMRFVVLRVMASMLGLRTGLAEFTYFAQHALFRTLETRQANADSVQLAEIYLQDPDQNQVDLSFATATNPSGDNHGGDHPPSFAIDKSGTKWLDYNKQDLIISLPTPYTAIRYCGILLAEDRHERDPVMFELLLSPDAVTWVLVYKNSNPANVPDIRQHSILNLPLAAQFQDFFLEITAVRNGDQVQVSEIQFWDVRSPPAELDLVALGAQAWSWGQGSSPSGEEPGKAVDGDVSTQWLESSIHVSGGLHIRLSNPVSLSSWTWVTSSNFVERDPVQWNFYGLYMESDNINMVPLHQQSTTLQVPLDRQVSVEMLSIATVLGPLTTASSSTVSSTSASRTTSTSASSTSTSSASSTSTSSSSTSTSTSHTTSSSYSTTSTSTLSTTMSSTTMTTSVTTITTTSTSSSATASSATSTPASSTSTSSASATSTSSSSTSISTSSTTSSSAGSTSTSSLLTTMSSKTITTSVSTTTTSSSTSSSTSASRTTSTSASSTSTSSASSTSTSSSSTSTSTSHTTSSSYSTTSTSTLSTTMSSTTMTTSVTTITTTSTSSSATASSTTSTSGSSISSSRASATSTWSSSSTSKSSTTMSTTTMTTVTVTSGDAAVLAALSSQLVGDLEANQIEDTMQLFRLLDSGSNDGNLSNPESYGMLQSVTRNVGTSIHTSLLRIGPSERAAGSVQVSAGKSRVDVPTALFTSEAHPEFAVVSSSDSMPGDEITETLSASTRASGNVLATQPISIKISLWEHGIKGMLPAPLNFTIPITDANASDLACVYWDEEQDAWSSEGVATVIANADGSVRCTTTHLSLFAAIAKAVLTTLVCSNAAAILSLDGLQSLLRWQWAVQAPALVQWFTLLAGLCLLLVARRLDQRYVEQVNALEEFQHMEILLEARPSRKDFVADLKEHFLGSFHPARRVASELVKRRIGLGVDELRRLQEVSGVTAWHHEASFLLSHLSERRFLFKLRMLYELHCRWFSFVTPSLKASCAQRCSVLLAKLYSGWAVMAVFYGSTSLAPGQPDCAPPEALLDKIVSSAVVAWISATFGSLPFVVLLSVLHRGRDGTSTMRANIFWGYMAIHTVFCAMVVSIFLASVGPADGEKFLISSLSDLLTSLLITPGLMTVLFGACLLVRADDLDLLDWEQEDLFDVSIASFEVPLQDLQTALKLDSGLFVTVVAEVFGDHASAVELKRDSVSRFSSMEAILVAKSQTLLFTVVLEEIQRMSARTLHAVISGGDVATGYSGSVPLFAAGTSSPCAEVFVQTTTKGDEAERPDTIPDSSNGPEGSKKDVILGVSFLEMLQASEEKGPDHSQPVPLRTAAEASIPLEPMNRETPPPEATPHPKRKSQMSSDSCAAEAEASIPLEPMRSQPQLHEPTPVSSDSCATEAEASIPLEPMRSQPQLHEPTPARPKRRSQMGPSLYPQARTSQCSGSQSLQSGEVS